MASDILTLDFETYYSTDYSLKKLPTILYVRDPRFKVHGAALKWGANPAKWHTGSELAEVFAHIDWGTTTVVSHNALFDMLILYEKYGVKPHRMVDTEGLARVLLPQDIDRDLGSLAKLLGVGEKGKELVLSKGMRDLTPEIEKALAGYAEQDATLTWGIYEMLMPHLPSEEAELMHMTIRMGTQGVLTFDTSMGKQALADAIEARRTKIEACGETLDDLRSRDKFADMLRARGVEPPTKINAKGKTTYAFSKQDPEFAKLQTHPKVADLVAARLAATSNNAIKRVERFIAIANAAPHTLPMPLNYGGAHTFRWSGCLTGDTQIHVLRDGAPLTVPITNVQNTDLVWDGEEYVPHQGVKFSGIQDVIEYQGIVGTRDHVVFTDEGPCELHTAAKEGRNIQTGNPPDITRVYTAGHGARINIMPGAGNLRELREAEVSPCQRCVKDKPPALHGLREEPGSERQSPDARDESSGCYNSYTDDSAQAGDTNGPIHRAGLLGKVSAPAMHKPSQCCIPQLRRQRDQVQIQYQRRSNSLGLENPRPTTRGCIDRSDQQQQHRSLRTGQPALGYENRASQKQTPIQNFGEGSADSTVTSATTGLHLRGNSALNKPRTDRRGDHIPTKGAAPVYDIVNCGPRNRFVANGKLVHNSGGINVQNLNRGSVLRRAIKAPDGYVIIVVDSAQIELRFNMWFSGQRNVLDILAPGEYVETEDSILWKGYNDVYRMEAANQFNVPVDQVTKEQRQFGKVIQLAAGYGMGATKFRVTCAIGPMGNPPIYISDEQAYETISTYRSNHPFVKASWDYLQYGAIPMMQQNNTSVEHKAVVIEHEAIRLPSGLRLLYPNIRADEEYGGVVYGINGRTHRLYGGKLQENLVQALARQAIAEQMLTAEREIPDFLVVSQTHDEIIGIHPEDDALDALRKLVEIMSRSPSWAPDLPLAAEGGFAREYSK